MVAKWSFSQLQKMNYLVVGIFYDLVHFLLYLVCGIFFGCVICLVSGIVTKGVMLSLKSFAIF